MNKRYAMKSFAMKLVVFTTLFLVVFTILSQTDTSLGIMYALFILGNVLVIVMVYSVLTDNYKTNQTFQNWYRDRPRNPEE